jgi:hypothetical protein
MRYVKRNDRISAQRPRYEFRGRATQLPNAGPPCLLPREECVLSRLARREPTKCYDENEDIERRREDGNAG